MSPGTHDLARPRLLASAPESIIEHVRDLLATSTLREVPASDGFTDSVASIIEAADGRQVFVKAGRGSDAGGQAVRTGAELASVITDLGPALLSSAEREGWYVAVYERLEGETVDLWTPHDVSRLAAIAIVMHERFTPSPVPNTAPYAREFAPLLGIWSALNGREGSSETTVDHVRGKELPYGLRVEALADLEADWSEALLAGPTLQHGDIRRDNVMREPSGRLRLVDWTHRWTAPSWADWVRLVPDLALDGLAPERTFRQIYASDADEHAVNVMLAGLAGRCWRDGHLEAVPDLPGLRPMQLAQGDMTLRWLAERGAR